MHRYAWPLNATPRAKGNIKPTRRNSAFDTFPSRCRTSGAILDQPRLGGFLDEFTKVKWCEMTIWLYFHVAGTIKNMLAIATIECEWMSAITTFLKSGDHTALHHLLFKNQTCSHILHHASTSRCLSPQKGDEMSMMRHDAPLFIANVDHQWRNTCLHLRPTTTVWEKKLQKRNASSLNEMIH